ncbi:MAG: hypothetical protein IT555_13985 [Acetobacteraceae bacterium]|nr:hypothetical protein [Acetobacteraceae bacterium]
MQRSDEIGAIFNDVTSLARDLWNLSESVNGLSTDPKMLSVALFRRLWSNQRGFALLWNDQRLTEGALVLRAAIEAAICLAANAALGDDFVLTVRQDAVESIKRQSKMYEDDGAYDMARQYKATFLTMANSLPSERPPKVLSWSDLSKAGGVEVFYTLHRSLSGLHAHVTGLSLMYGIVGADGDGKDLQEVLQKYTLSAMLPQMASATLIGCDAHSRTLGFAEFEARAVALIGRLNEATNLRDSPHIA